MPTGLVRFSNPEDAARAMEALQGHKLGEDDEASRTVGMSVSLAMSKSERDARRAERRAAWEREKAERAERRRLWEERNAAWAAKQAERARRDARARDRVAIHVRNCPVGLEGDQLGAHLRAVWDGESREALLAKRRQAVGGVDPRQQTRGGDGRRHARRRFPPRVPSAHGDWPARAQGE